MYRIKGRRRRSLCTDMSKKLKDRLRDPALCKLQRRITQPVLRFFDISVHAVDSFKILLLLGRRPTRSVPSLPPNPPHRTLRHCRLREISPTFSTCEVQCITRPRPRRRLSPFSGTLTNGGGPKRSNEAAVPARCGVSKDSPSFAYRLREYRAKGFISYSASLEPLYHTLLTMHC